MKLNKFDFSKWASIGIVALCGVLLLYFAFPFVFSIFLPFVIAWLISAMVTPPARRIAKKIKIPEKAVSVFFVALTLAALGVVIFIILNRILYETQNFLLWLGKEGDMVNEYIQNIESFFERLGAKIPMAEHLWGKNGFFHTWDGMDDMIGDILSETIKNTSASIPTKIAELLKACPKVLLFLVVTVIASFYFCLYRDGIGRAVREILPEKYSGKIPEIKKSMAGTAVKYVKAYLLILLMTFGELYVGFAILKIKYSFLLALVIAVIDILPVLGTGTVLVPWAIILLIGKNYYIGFGLLIMYGVILLIRQIAEPKIVGKSIGLNPLVTLVAMYAGFKLFGIFGMILGPATALIVKSFIPKKEKSN